MIQSVITECASMCSLLFVLDLPPSRCSWVPDSSCIVWSREGLFCWFFKTPLHYLQNYKQAPLSPFFLGLKYWTLSKLTFGEWSVKSLLKTDPLTAPRAVWMWTWVWFHNLGLSAYCPFPWAFLWETNFWKGKLSTVVTGFLLSAGCWRQWDHREAKIAFESCSDVAWGFCRSLYFPPPPSNVWE